MIRLHIVINMEKPNRKPNRIADYDYSQSGAYFVTICTQDRKKILSKISVGTPLPGCPQIPHDENGHPGTGVPTVELLWHGEIANQYIRQMDTFYEYLSATSPCHNNSTHGSCGHPGRGVPTDILDNIFFRSWVHMVMKYAPLWL